ncbi:MAG TPA: MarP family serine protease [Candidatus Limnocylindrales bacterium]|nr:MarP family serine protease [Candidatus Limnocylindrales bacterium]
MNPLDLVAIGILLIAVILGVRSGALPQLIGLLGAAIAALAGLAVLPAFTGLLDGLPPPIRAIVVLSVLLGLVGLGEALGAAMGRQASQALGEGLWGAFDRVAGGIVGAGQAILILWLAGGVIASGPFPTLSSYAQKSTALRVVDTFLPPPTEIVLGLGNLLDDSGLPNVFIGLEQLPAPAIDLPSNAVAREIGERAAPSVLRVQADGCGQRASGSSFVIAPGYLVTNAHVVVGARSIFVQTSGESYGAVPVLVDLELDIAVLFAGDVTATPLHFTTGEPSRGDIGATVGYPGGGNETVEPATVAAAYLATGLDVTGDNRVTRRIVELRATVIPGDSGGPLVLEDGTVGGVVFAESKVDPAVGYALAPNPVIDAITPALGRTAAVATGPCVH